MVAQLQKTRTGVVRTKVDGSRDKCTAEDDPCPGQCRRGGGGGRLTTHLVFTSILTAGASNGEDRRGFGTDGVNSLKSRRGVGIGPQVLIHSSDGGAGTSSKRVSNRHGCRSKQRMLVKTGEELQE
jgi:hypothetical protein